MSGEPLPSQLDRLSDSSAGIGVGKTREEYLRQFARPCASPQYDRPYSSPVPGPYRASNTSTSLFLLNQRNKNSHLREQTLLEEFSSASQNSMENESVIEPERSRSRLTHRLMSPRVPVDPHRHFESRFSLTNPSCALFSSLLLNIQGQNKYWHNRRCASSSLIEHPSESSPEATTTKSATGRSCRRGKRSIAGPRRSQSVLSKQESTVVELSTKPMTQSSQQILEKSKRFELDFEQYSLQALSKPKRKPPGTRPKSPLRKDQQLYLLAKMRIYDTTDSKLRRSNSYSQVLSSRLKTDSKYKPKFRLNDPGACLKYNEYLRVSRSISSSSFSMRSNDYSRDPANHDVYSTVSIINTKSRLTRPPLSVEQLGGRTVRI